MLSDKQLIILLAVYERKTLMQMANMIGRSIGIVQRQVKYLEEKHLITSHKGPGGGGLARGRELTQEAISLLRKKGHKL